MSNTKSTAVAKSTERQTPALSPEREAKIAEAKARSAVARAIKGTIWGKDLHQTVIDAVVAYCRQNGLDAVRHVEVLGGNIYLTATFYEERGAPLLYSGEVVMEEPDYINADARLDELAKDGSEWAAKERERRIQERIRWNVPETAKAAVVQRATLRSGMVAVGVNWCGGLAKKDPVGEAEPAKTAQTRALRRCWRRIADFVPSYGAVVKPVAENAKTALPVAIIEPEQEPARTPPQFGGADDPYLLNAGGEQPQQRPETEDEQILREDQEIARSEQRELGDED